MVIETETGVCITKAKLVFSTKIEGRFFAKKELDNRSSET
jgi:hypothetical protein